MVKNISGQNFNEEVKNASKPVVIDFFAEWCGPCQQMAPHFDALAKELSSSYIFGKVDIDNERDLAIQHGISSIPTIVFYKDGAVVGSANGFHSKDELKVVIAKFFGN